MLDMRLDETAPHPPDLFVDVVRYESTHLGHVDRGPVQFLPEGACCLPSWPGSLVATEASRMKRKILPSAGDSAYNRLAGLKEGHLAGDAGVRVRRPTTAD